MSLSSAVNLISFHLLHLRFHEAVPVNDYLRSPRRCRERQSPSVLCKAQESWGGCWKVVGSGDTTISPGGSGHMESVEIEAIFYLCHLCLSAPDLVLLFPMGPTAQNSKGESGKWKWGLGSLTDKREGDLFSSEEFKWFSGNKRSCFFCPMPRVF